MAALKTLWEIHNLTTRTDSHCGTYVAASFAIAARDKWAETWPSNRYEVYRGEYHSGGSHGPFVAVYGPGIEGAAEYAAPVLKRDSAISARISEAIAYTLDKVARPGLAEILCTAKGMVFWRLASGLYQVNRDRDTPPPDGSGYGDLDALKRLKGVTAADEAAGLVTYP